MCCRCIQIHWGLSRQNDGNMFPMEKEIARASESTSNVENEKQTQTPNKKIHFLKILRNFINSCVNLCQHFSIHSTKAVRPIRYPSLWRISHFSFSFNFKFSQKHCQSQSKHQRQTSHFGFGKWQRCKIMARLINFSAVFGFSRFLIALQHYDDGDCRNLPQLRIHFHFSQCFYF